MSYWPITCISATVAIVAAVLLCLFFLAIMPFYRLWLRAKRREIVLFHYTSSENAESILESGRILASKKKKNKDRCYFFILGKKPIPESKLQRNLDESKLESVVIIKGLTEAQIKMCRYGMQRYAVEHKGDFVFCDENQRCKTDRITFEAEAYHQSRHK